MLHQVHRLDVENPWSRWRQVNCSSEILLWYLSLYCQRRTHRRKTRCLQKTHIHIFNLATGSNDMLNRDPSLPSNIPLHPTQPCIPLDPPFLLLHTHNLNKLQLRGLLRAGVRGVQYWARQVFDWSERAAESIGCRVIPGRRGHICQCSVRLTREDATLTYVYLCKHECKQYEQKVTHTGYVSQAAWQAGQTQTQAAGRVLPASISMWQMHEACVFRHSQSDTVTEA